MSEAQIFSISELATMFDISSRAIRYYEEVGILTPLNRESLTKQRYYPNEQRRRLKLILRGKKLGFSLQEIKEMVDLYEDNPEGEEEKQRILAFADQKLFEIEDQIRELQLLKEEIIGHKKRYVGRQEEK